MVDYEKLYKETLAKAREIHRNVDEKRFEMEWLFPELKESEGERIKREIIEFINSFKVATLNTSKVRKFESWITWIEKQGELPISEENPLKPAWSLII